MTNIIMIYALYGISVEIYGKCKPKGVHFKVPDADGNISYKDGPIGANREYVKEGYLFMVGDMKRWQL